MPDIEQVDATQGAGEPLYLGFAKVNEIITKINAIEAGATQDQSGAEIKALLEALIDKLSIAAVKETDTKKILTATERTSLAANIAKLAGIENNAKDDQTGAEIKALLEALADKLSIEAGVKETDNKKVMTADERTGLAANTSEIVTARGSKASLDARLDVILEDDGTPKDSKVTSRKLDIDKSSQIESGANPTFTTLNEWVDITGFTTTLELNVASLILTKAMVTFAHTVTNANVWFVIEISGVRAGVWFSPRNIAADAMSSCSLSHDKKVTAGSKTIKLRYWMDTAGTLTVYGSPTERTRLDVVALGAL